MSTLAFVPSGIIPTQRFGFQCKPGLAMVSDEDKDKPKIGFGFKADGKVSAALLGSLIFMLSSYHTLPFCCEQMTDVTMKFGGSSLANADRIVHVTELIKDQIALGYRPRAVICSAMGKTTNNLLGAGDFALDGRVDIDAIRSLHVSVLDTFNMNNHVREEVNDLLDECEDLLNGVRLIQELSPKSLDQLVSYGERCAVRLVAARLNQIGVPAQAFDAWDVGVLTDSNFMDARLLPSSEDAIHKAFQRIDPSIVAVVTGFIGHDPKGKITTLGRGGSDLTATALGSALKVDEIQVWKDVDGILTADPRLVKSAIPVADVSYDEASELAYFGAQVLHPIAMQPAMKYNVPVRVKNSYNPNAEGSLIKKRDGPAPQLVRKSNFSYYARRILSQFNNHDIIR
jgi:aspartate kinase